MATAARTQEVSWRPTKQNESEFTGRKIEICRHGSIEEWGCADAQQDTFLAFHSHEPRANAPHGFGYRHDAKPSAAARWPERFIEWLGDSGLK